MNHTIGPQAAAISVASNTATPSELELRFNAPVQAELLDGTTWNFDGQSVDGPITQLTDTIVRFDASGQVAENGVCTVSLAGTEAFGPNITGAISVLAAQSM